MSEEKRNKYSKKAKWDDDYLPTKHKKEKKDKPYRIQVRLLNPEEVTDWLDKAFYGTGEWVNYFGRYENLKNAEKALNDIKRNRENSIWRHGNPDKFVKLDYRIDCQPKKKKKD